VNTNNMNNEYGGESEHVLPTLLEQYSELGVEHEQALKGKNFEQADEIHDRRRAILRRIRERYPHFDQEQEAA